MKVIGIDPAPSKESTIFDGEKPSHKNFENLKSLLNNLQEPTLICWDAPLTGPCDKAKSRYWRRPIEEFFCLSKNKPGTIDNLGRIVVPPGVSVLGYAGCPHWTISQAMLGLPQIPQVVGSANNKAEIPFELCTSTVELKNESSVVEVHPAVAIWLWCKNNRNSDKENFWKYKPTNRNGKPQKKDSKARKDNFIELWDILNNGPLKEFEFPDPDSDDQLDALVAYALGTIWMADKDKEESEKRVVFLGDEENGGFLVPNELEIKKHWGNFKK